MYYFEKDNLVEYIIWKHYKAKLYRISPVKLQKTLYLLYAMWAGDVVNLNEEIMPSNEGIAEYHQKFEIDLFEPEFEAWKYGPVDRAVFQKFKDDQYFCEDEVYLDLDRLNGAESTVLSFIESIIAQTFDISDFTLVELSHRDVAWQEAYHQDTTGKTLINKRDIINEYAERLLKQKAEE